MSSEPLHVWYHCGNCGAAPIVGTCYRCRTCPAGPDNDLCEACYRRLQAGQLQHPQEDDYRAAAAGAQEHVFAAFEGQLASEYDAWLAVPDVQAIGPTVPDRFVVRPQFEAGRTTTFGSHGFVIEDPAGSRILFVTALHVLDELIRKLGIDATAASTTYTGRELPAAVDNVVLYDVFAAQWMVADLTTARPMLVLPDARTDQEEPCSDLDVTAFVISDPTRVQPARLAEAPPQVGEPIWLAATPEGAPTQRSCAAVVVESTPQTLVFRFSGPTPATKYTSGAPLLDAEGEVVGINVGAGVLDGRAFGHGCTVTSVRRHLQS